MKIQIIRYEKLPKSVQEFYANDKRKLYLRIRVNKYLNSTCPMTLENILGLICHRYDW